MSSRYTLPGDPDIDISEEGLILQRYERVASEDLTYLLYLENLEEGTSVEITMALKSDAVGTARIESLLERWTQDEVLLYYISAPGRWALLYENDDHVIPLPLSR